MASKNGYYSSADVHSVKKENILVGYNIPFIDKYRRPNQNYKLLMKELQGIISLKKRTKIEQANYYKQLLY